MSERRIDIFNLLKNEGQLSTLYVYPSTQVETDPYEHTKTDVFMNPLPIKGLIRQVSFEALHWKYYGQIPVGSIEVIAEKKYLTLLRTADKIKYSDKYFKCYKDDSNGFAILERPDYVVIILEKKVQA
jgi:hypothetical protein